MNLPDCMTQYFEAIRTRNREAWLATFSNQEKLVHIDPVGTPGRSSKEEIGGFWDQITALFKEVELKPVTVYPGGPDHFALTWRADGVGFNGVAVQFDGIDLVTLDAKGKILRMEAYWDAAPTLSKLTPSA